MALETATHINDLVIANPTGLDDLGQGDDHIRLLKDILKRDIPLTAPATTVGMAALTSATSEAFRAVIGASNNPFRNRVINGDMSIDQRNNGAAQTIVAGAALAYTVDRFYAYCTGANVILQNLQTANYYQTQISGATSNSGVSFGTRIQARNSLDLAGLTTTLAARLAYSGGAITVTWNAYYANTTDAFGSIASPTKTFIASGTFAVTGTITNFTAQIAIPAAATTGIEVIFSVSSLASGSILLFFNVQIEKGTIATSDVVFEVADTPLQQTRCEYYYKNVNGGGGVTGFGSGRQSTTTSSRIWLPTPTMRAIPVVLLTGVMLDYAGAITAATLSSTYAARNSVMLDVTHAAVGAAGNGVGLQLPNGLANLISFNAEL